jgi:hypothetical protein
LMQGKSAEALDIQEKLLAEVGIDRFESMPAARRRSALLPLEGICLCYERMGRWREAAENFATARRLRSEMGDALWAAQCALGEGLNLLSAGELDQSESALNHAEAVLDEHKAFRMRDIARSALERLRDKRLVR